MHIHCSCPLMLANGKLFGKQCLRNLRHAYVARDLSLSGSEMHSGPASK